MLNSYFNHLLRELARKGKSWRIPTQDLYGSSPSPSFLRRRRFPASFTLPAPPLFLFVLIFTSSFLPLRLLPYLDVVLLQVFACTFFLFFFFYFVLYLPKFCLFHRSSCNNAVGASYFSISFYSFLLLFSFF